ncbi:MAG: hypothetical protein V1904_03720, partial [Bacteroidota bacterium]
DAPSLPHTPHKSPVIPSFHLLVAKGKNDNDVLLSLSKKSMANYTTRHFIWCYSSPIPSLGLLLFEKNIIGAFGKSQIPPRL